MNLVNFSQFALKVLASGLLVWITALCLLGLYRIWWARELVYRNFAYTRDGTDDAAAGLHLGAALLEQTENRVFSMG